jgi:hypothetical protein
MTAEPELMEVDTRVEQPREPEEEEQQQQQAEANAPPQGRLQRLMNMLRNGLSELRSSRLSREEVYQVEDMFMDMKRELYEAERRGRA